MPFGYCTLRSLSRSTFVALDRRRTLSAPGTADTARSAGFHCNGKGHFKSNGKGHGDRNGNGKHHFRFRQSLHPDAIQK